jgi:glutathione S-transferase
VKLFYAPNSPFARKLRIVLREAGILDRVPEQVVVLRKPENEVLKHGPTGRVPALLTDGGALLLECDVICRYLEDKGLVTSLRPTDPAEAERDLELDGVATELMESLSWRARELRFRTPEMRFAAFLEHEIARCRRILDWLESRADRLGPAPTIGQIALAVGLGTADQPLIGEPWRDGRPRLTQWFTGFAARPSVTETAFPGW